jgi:hypothetical protein
MKYKCVRNAITKADVMSGRGKGKGEDGNLSVVKKMALCTYAGCGAARFETSSWHNAYIFSQKFH